MNSAAKQQLVFNVNHPRTLRHWYSQHYIMPVSYQREWENNAAMQRNVTQIFLAYSQMILQLRAHLWHQR